VPVNANLLLHLYEGTAVSPFSLRRGPDDGRQSWRPPRTSVACSLARRASRSIASRRWTVVYSRQWRMSLYQSAQGVGVDQYVTKNSDDFLVHGRYKVGNRGEMGLAIGRQRFELDIAFAGFG